MLGRERLRERDFSMKLSNTGSGTGLLVQHILGDPGGHSGGEGTSKRAGKNIMARRKVRNVTVLYFSSGHFFRPFRLSQSPPLSAPGSPRMGPAFRSFFTKIQHPAFFFHPLSRIPLFFSKNNKIK